MNTHKGEINPIVSILKEIREDSAFTKLQNLMLSNSYRDQEIVLEN